MLNIEHAHKHNLKIMRLDRSTMKPFSCQTEYHTRVLPTMEKILCKAAQRAPYSKTHNQSNEFVLLSTIISEKLIYISNKF